MTTTGISPLGGIYREEAVRRLAVKTCQELTWGGNVGHALRMWIERVKGDLVADQTGFLSFPKAWMGSYPALASAKFFFGRAHVDPFRMDVFDCLVILASNDIDLAHDKNNRGPTRRWSPEARRILSQIRSCRCVSADDVATMMKIAKWHLEQIANHVAKVHRADPAGVFAILRQRVKQRGFAMPNRIKEILDNSFDFRRLNYIWSTSDTIRVHAPGRPRQKPFEDFYHQLKDSGQFSDFYTHSRGLIDPYGHRVINGNRERYQALRFPADPIVAQSLISIGEEEKESIGVFTVVDVTTRLLSQHVAGQPMLLGQTDPGLIVTDYKDDPGFNR